LAQGEVAINVTDKKVWVGNAATTPVQLLGTGSDGSFTNLTVTNNATFDTTTLVVDATNNRVGVGTASPATKLQITDGAIRLSSTYELGWGDNSVYLSANTSTGFMQFVTGSSERMRIDASGNVGIGNTASWLYGGLSVGTGATNTGITIYASSSGESLLAFADGTSGTDRYTGFVNYNHTSNFLAFGTNGGTERMRITSDGVLLTNGLTSSPGKADPNASGVGIAINTKLELRWNSTNAAIYGGAGGGDDNLYYYSGLSHIWRSNGTERMRLDSSGNLLVGTTSVGVNQKSIFKTTTSAVWPLSLEGNNRGMLVIQSASSGIAAYFQTSTNTVAGYIDINGSTTSYVTSSDYRLKENIAPMTGALAKVQILKPVTYTWKADGKDGEGFIAHELQAVVPNCVVGEKDAVNEDGSIKPQGIDTSFLVATLTAAIQEQQEIINDLKARIETLESK
jgi:hypothetical protein